MPNDMTPTLQAPWAVRLGQGIAANEQTARALVAGLTREQLNWQPAPGSWSVGQCLEHLCATNDCYLAPIREALAGRPEISVEEIHPGWFARWFLRSFVEPTAGGKRAQAPAKIQPASQVELSVLDHFLASNEALREVISQAQRKDVNRIRFKNPFVPGLRFSVGTGFEILVLHERRHLLQAERARNAAGFPAGA